MDTRRKPPSRLDEHGVRQVAPTWESLVDRQIREAMEEGKFNNLPLHGKPLPIEDDTFAGEWAMAFRMLRNAGAAPPWIEADKTVRELLAKREAIFTRAAQPGLSAFVKRRDRRDLERIVVELNVSVARVNAEAPTYAQHRRPLVLRDELERLDELQRGSNGR
jgi:hypothetical protein